MTCFAELKRYHALQIVQPGKKTLADKAAKGETAYQFVRPAALLESHSVMGTYSLC